MKQKLSNIAYVIVSLGLVGLVPAARVWGSLLGIPLLWLFSWLHALAPTAGLVCMASTLAIMFGLSWFVRRDVTEEREADIVLDRLAGVVVALAWLPSVTIKFLLFGFCVFHLWLFMSVLAQRVYAYDNKTATGGVTLSSGEIVLLALMTNGVLHLLWWIAH
ncbi:MAG: hypothetical protein QG604_551 [Candidatus Dependentiae bacterium]|nr:hypothetical protein [Candidatus Dependentiae bacterium]